MSKKHQCPRCLQNFSSLQRVKSHLSRKMQCEIINPDYNSDDLGVTLNFPAGSCRKAITIHEKLPKQACKLPKNSKKSQKNPKKPADFTKSPSDFTLTKKNIQKNNRLSTNPNSGKINNFLSVDNSENEVADHKHTKHNLTKRKKYRCEYCGFRFTRKDNMKAHQRKSCRVLVKGENFIESSPPPSPSPPEPARSLPQEKKTPQHLALEAKVEMLEKQIAQLMDKPNVINNQNILQVVCVGNNDNYLDMLTEQWGFDKALGFIRDCALSNVSGDCKLIEKIYLDDDQTTIRYVDRSKTKIEYFNERREKVIDNKGLQLGKKLANNLQNSYLKGVNYLINNNLENKVCTNKFLEDYDLQTWNQHIYELSDTRYQKRIVNQLNIPHN